MADWYRDTERRIARYWSLQDRVARLKAAESTIVENLRTLYAELAAARGVPSYTSKYGILPGSSRGQDKDYSDLMAEVEGQVDKLSKRIVHKQKRLVSIRHRIQEAKEELAPMEIVMARLTQEELKLTELRYVYRRSYYTIAAELPLSKSAAIRTHKKIICKVASWLGKR